MTSLQGADDWICQSGFLHTGIVRIAAVGESLAMSLSETTSLPSLGRLRPRMIVPSQLFFRRWVALRVLALPFTVLL